MSTVMITDERLREPLIKDGVDVAPSHHNEIPSGFVRTVDGKVILREKAVFLLRDVKTSDGRKLKAASDRLYEVGKGGTLTRIGKPFGRMSKKQRREMRRRMLAEESSE